MNIDKLKMAQANFLLQYPEGFADPGLAPVRKKHNVDKLTEFLRSFVGGQLRRFEGHAQFPVLQFLALLFKYTFLQTNVESFYSCLEAWNTCMDYISTALGNRRTEGLRILERYTIKR